MTTGTLKEKLSSPLAKEILIYVLMASSFFSLFATAIMGSADYFERIDTLEKNTQHAISLFLPSVNNSLWELNDKQIRLDLLGILRFEEVNQVKIIVDGEDFMNFGNSLDTHVRTYKRHLGVSRNGEFFSLGTLVVSADLRPVYNDSIQNLLFIFLIQLVKSTAVSVVILYLLNLFLIKKLKHIFLYLKKYDFNKINEPLALPRRTHLFKETEIDLIVSSINTLSEKYLKSKNQRDQAIEALTELNKNLETEILQRVETITRQKEILLNTNKLQEIGKLAGNLAHEINNPLGIISGYTSILAKHHNELVELPEEKVTKYLEAIEKNVIRIKKIIFGMLRLSYQSPTDQLETDHLSLILTDIVNVSQLNSEHRHIEFSRDSQFSDALIYAPNSTISQVLVCLVNNAIDEIKDLDKPHIEFMSYINENSHLQIHVIDNGPGISSAVEQSLFDPFVTTKAKGKGTGLGLSICVNLLNGMESLIRFERKDDRTHFIITIPKKYYDLS